MAFSASPVLVANFHRTQAALHVRPARLMLSATISPQTVLATPALKDRSARTLCLPTFNGCPDAGAYKPRNDTQLCCALGEVLLAGMSTCMPCHAGTYFHMSSYTCVGCEAGSYAATPRLLECTSCASGKYQPSPYQSVCLDCPVKTISSLGASTCMNAGVWISIWY
jgi:hypothetical protein